MSASIQESLCRIGVLVKTHQGLEPAGPEARQALQVFAPLLRDHDIRLATTPLPGCPIHFCTAILRLPGSAPGAAAAGPRAFPAGGQGPDAVSAAISCIGELCERLSLCSLGEEDPRVEPFDPSEPDIELSAILGYSRAQEAAMARHAAGIDPHNAALGIAWNKVSGRRVPVKNLHSREPAQLPALGALFFENTEGRSGVAGQASSTGCAVWSHLEGARERAILELAERDAVAQAWYNRLGITLLPNGVLREILPVDLTDFLGSRSRSWAVFGVDTDLPVHVAVAISHRGDGLMAAFGSSAGWNLSGAVGGAVKEMLQAEMSLELMDKVYPKDCVTMTGSCPAQLRYARSRSIADDWPFDAATGSRPASVSTVFSYQELLEATGQAGIEIWEFDATRPDLKVPCIKLFSPDLCSWQPRFGKSRLFNGVVTRGLRAEPAAEETFAERPFPF